MAHDTPQRPPAPAPATAPTAQRAPATPPAPAGTAATAAAAASAAAGLSLHAPQALYPGADPARTPAGLGAGWLIVAELPPTPGDPLASDAGRLLDNMLRAMQLHRHPRVFLAALERAAPAGKDGSNGDTALAADLADAVATLRPAMVLVLGHVAARAALGSTEPLGRLRAGPHILAGCPAVVTYDPAFLLRSQDSKAAAWADLARALATVRAAAA
jgi:DNA polymerase